MDLEVLVDQRRLVDLEDQHHPVVLVDLEDQIHLVDPADQLRLVVLEDQLDHRNQYIRLHQKDQLDLADLVRQ